jgi:hypothetical protein
MAVQARANVFAVARLLGRADPGRGTPEGQFRCPSSHRGPSVEQAEVGKNPLSRSDDLSGDPQTFGGFVDIDGLVSMRGVLDLVSPPSQATVSRKGRTELRPHRSLDRHVATRARRTQTLVREQGGTDQPNRVICENEGVSWILREQNPSGGQRLKSPGQTRTAVSGRTGDTLQIAGGDQLLNIRLTGPPTRHSSTVPGVRGASV